MEWSLLNLFRDSQEDRQLPTEFESTLANHLQSNGIVNYGVYMPKNTQVTADYNSTSFGVPKSAGFVNTFANNNVAHINRDTLPGGKHFSGTSDLFDTLFHESAHTVQSSRMNAGKMKGLKFEDYSMDNEYPRVEEILATLRATEASRPAGKTVWGTDQGRQVVDRMQSLNPTMSKEGVKRYVDTKMFPEHSVMHEWNPKESSTLQPSWYDKHLDMIKNLLK